MSDESEHEKLNEIDSRIQALKSRQEQLSNNKVAADSSGSTGNAAYEMIGTVIACVIVGWLMDKYLHTNPWGILGMLLVGCAAGAANVWRLLKGHNQSVGIRKKDSGR